MDGTTHALLASTLVVEERWAVKGHREGERVVADGGAALHTLQILLCAVTRANLRIADVKGKVTTDPKQAEGVLAASYQLDRATSHPGLVGLPHFIAKLAAFAHPRVHGGHTVDLSYNAHLENRFGAEEELRASLFEEVSTHVVLLHAPATIDKDDNDEHSESKEGQHNSDDVEDVEASLTVSSGSFPVCCVGGVSCCGHDDCAGDGGEGGG